MIRQKIVVYASVILLLFIIGISCFLDYIYNSEKAFISVNESLNNIDTDLINNNDLINILEKCNYNSKNKTCFDSSPLFSSTNTYYMYWGLKLMLNAGYDIAKFTTLRDIPNSIKLSNPQYSELDNLRMVTGIYFLLKLNNIEKATILETVMKHYDPGAKMFFWENKDESISDKISATSVSLEIIGNIGMLKNIKEINDIKFKLIKLYSTDKYFNAKSANECIVNNGGVIIESLLLIGIDSKDQAVLESVKGKRLEWLKYWNNNILNTASYNFFSILLLNEMIKINNFYKSDFSIPATYLNELFKQQTSFDGIGYDKIESSKEAYNIEPQILNMLLNLCNNIKYSFPYRNELDSYINETVKTQFCKNANIIPSVINNYYGLILSNRVGFNYDKGKMQKTLEGFFIKYIEEDSNIDGHKKLLQIYYLILSYKELKIDLPDKDVIVNSIQNYLSNLKYDNINQIIDAISDFKMGLEIIDYLHKNINGMVKKSAISLIERADGSDDVYKNIIVTDLYDIIVMIHGRKAVNELYRRKFLDALNSLQVEGSYKVRIGSTGEPDIISTFNAIKTKSYLTTLNGDEKKQLKSFLNSLKDERSLFKISQSGSGADLQVIFDALSLSYYYN